MKAKVIKKNIKDEGIVEIFMKLVGEGSADVEIVAPKYEGVMGKMEKILGLLKCIMEPNIINGYIYENYRIGVNDILSYIEKIQQFLYDHELEVQEGRLNDNDLKKINSDPQLLEEYLSRCNERYDREELAQTYTSIKTNDITADLITVMSNIKYLLSKSEYEDTHDLEDPSRLSYEFITNSEEDTAILNPICRIDFKLFFMDEIINKDIKDMFLRVLQIIYKHSLYISQTISTPDVSAEEFTTIIDESLKKLKKIPELSGCHKAFSKLSNSKVLFENNFDSYYKDFVKSQNPGIMLESFISDVAKQEDTNKSLVPQLRKIVSYYRKNMSKISDPKINTLFNMLEKNFSILES